MTNPGHHFVAGNCGAISGSVAAEILADHGIRVAVCSTRIRRRTERSKTVCRVGTSSNANRNTAESTRAMKKPNVYFIPSTKLGRDLIFPSFQVGLFRGDSGQRRVARPGIGVCQKQNSTLAKVSFTKNPFIYWYNHKNEKDYHGPRYETPDEAVVVGGGLASIDVVKVLQIRKLRTCFEGSRHSNQDA